MQSGDKHQAILADERRKYVAAYADGDYRMNDGRQAASFGLVEPWEPGKLLDVSCGIGEFMRWMERRGFQVSGTEIVPQLIGGSVVESFAHRLPFDDNAFDYATSFDVMEHLPPGDEILALQEMNRVAVKGVAVSACPNRSRFGHGGVEYHINIRPIEEWSRLLADVFPGGPHRPELHSSGGYWLIALV